MDAAPVLMVQRDVCLVFLLLFLAYLVAIPCPSLSHPLPQFLSFSSCPPFIDVSLSFSRFLPPFFFLALLILFLASFPLLQLFFFVHPLVVFSVRVILSSSHLFYPSSRVCLHPCSLSLSLPPLSSSSSFFLTPLLFPFFLSL